MGERDMDAQLNDTSSTAGVGQGTPPHAAHAAQLHALLSTFTTAVALEMRCELDDAPTGEPHNREAFRAHFAALEASVDRWNAAVDRAQAAPEALWRRLTNSAREHGITEPPFMVGALIDHLATHTLQRSRRFELEAPHETILQHFEDRLAGGEYVSVYLLGRRVATLPGGSGEEVRRRVEAADALIQALFDDASSCSEATQVARSRDSLLELKQTLAARARQATIDATIGFVASCPCCQVRLSSAFEAAPARPSAS